MSMSVYNSCVIINVHKPKGSTSFNMVYQARKKLGVKKVGHAGTLDPLAEGVLIILTESDTKRQDEFMHMEKEYVAEIGFGLSNSCLDMEQVPEIVLPLVSLTSIREKLPNLLKDFIGVQDQEAPIYSAKKQDGKAFYKFVRKGNALDIKPKVSSIEIKELEIIDTYISNIKTTTGDFEIPVVKIRIKCSSGTYIRSLARDISIKLGTKGILLSLLRTKVGSYSLGNSTTL